MKLAPCLIVAAGMLALCPIARAKAIKLKCTYQSVHDPTKSGPQSADNFSLEFVVDSVSRNAVMVGNNGMSEVVYLSGDDGFTFIETLKTGAVQTTTVAHSGQSVHSRHTMVIGVLTPSQYYGDCK